ncbi:hypothetical protein BDW27_110168 [Nocardiopsis sp. L17-MgMaSL7]|nr:hypothetical protein BDW27_110168 [Nocardiopsis sp. L17-MgMaSL7]
MRERPAVQDLRRSAVESLRTGDLLAQPVDVLGVHAHCFLALNDDTQTAAYAERSWK